MVIGQSIPFGFGHLLPVPRLIASPFAGPIRACNLPKCRSQVKEALAFLHKIALVPPVADLAPEHPILALHGSRKYKPIAVLAAGTGTEAPSKALITQANGAMMCLTACRMRWFWQASDRRRFPRFKADVPVIASLIGDRDISVRKSYLG